MGAPADTNSWDAAISVGRWFVDLLWVPLAALVGVAYRAKADKTYVERQINDAMLELNEKIEGNAEKAERRAGEDRQHHREAMDRMLKVWNETDSAHDKLQIDSVMARIEGLEKRMDSQYASLGDRLEDVQKTQQEILKLLLNGNAHRP